jgi:outer membrane protein
MPTMIRFPALALTVALGFAATSGAAAGEDLLQIYRDALTSDPTLAAARSTYAATQELLPQARSGLLPVLSVLGNANYQKFNETIHIDPTLGQRDFDQRFPLYGYSVQATQPLFRMQNWITFEQSKQQVGQGEYVLASAQQDLIVRVVQAYLDVLLAQFTIELTESQKAAVSENLAQAKRNFEVGVATITDTNDAQAKYDQIVAQELQVQNDLDNKIAALRAIIGRAPKELKRFERGFEPQLPSPNALEPWIEKSIRDNYQVKIAQANYDIAALEVDRQRAGHLPTLDLVANFNQTYQGGAASTNISANFAQDTRAGLIGVQLNVPIYTGGLINSRVRQAVANLDVARQNLEAARRAAQLLAQTSFSGVTSGVAQVKALEQAVKSAVVSYDSNKLGLEVGVRTNLDVLNQQQQVYQTRFNLAQAYYNFVISALKLKQAAGTLSDEDVERVNRELG